LGRPELTQRAHDASRILGVGLDPKVDVLGGSGPAMLRDGVRAYDHVAIDERVRSYRQMVVPRVGDGSDHAKMVT
jgi:hypothetical protein